MNFQVLRIAAATTDPESLGDKRKAVLSHRTLS